MATTTDQSKSKGRRARGPQDGVPGFTVTLFFVFMLINFAIYSLMFCTVGTTMLGIGLLSLALLLTISGYLAGA